MVPPLSRSSRASRTSTSGFTLVEIAMAIGIIAFAFVALLALLPAGNNAFRRAIDIQTCGQIAQRVIGDATQTDFRTLIDTRINPSPFADPPNFTFRAPKRAEGLFRYFDEQGREVLPANPKTLTTAERKRAIYYVNTRIMPQPPLPGPLKVKLATQGDAQPLAQLTVQVAYNPNHLEIAMSAASPTSDDPNRNLWVPKPEQASVQLYTFPAMIGRTE